MGDIFEDGWDFLIGLATSVHGLPNPIDEKLKKQGSDCVKQALAAQQKNEDYILDLAKNWHPTGFYGLAEAQKLVAQVDKLLLDSADTLKNAPTAGASDAAGQIRNELSRIADWSARGQKYRDGIKDAKYRGISFIDAPDLRHWVIYSMRQASDSVVTAMTLVCDRNLLSWVQGAGELISSLVGKVWEVAKAVYGFVADIATLAVQIPKAAPKFLNLLAWSAGIGAAVWTYKKLKEKAK
jgi:hypothetical protein